MTDHWQKWQDAIYSDKSDELTPKQFYEIINVLCNKVDQSIMTVTNELAGQPYRKDIHNLHLYALLFESLYEARAIANKLDKPKK